MDANLDRLIQQASLSIIESAHHKRSNLNVRGRVLPCYIMTYLKSGHAQVYIRGQVYECGPGTIALIPAGEEHDHIASQTEDEPAEFLWWHFTYLIAGTIDVFRFFNWPMTFELKENTHFEEVYFQFLKHVNNKSSITDTIMANAKSLEIMALLIDNVLECDKLKYRQNGEIPEQFFAILNDIAEHPENGIHLRELAVKYHMHPTYISNRFKHHFGIAPTKFYHEMIVQKAKRLLLASNNSITDIAYELGFSDLSAFSQVFTRIEGRPPTQFRQNGLL